MKKIVTINGSGASGKDEIAKIAQELLEKVKIKVISSIDAIKDRALLFGWDGGKDNNSRRFLSDLKDAWTRYNEGPFSDIVDKLNALDDDKDWLIFIHIREPEEILKMSYYQKYGKPITLLIRRPNIENFYNHADQNVEEYPYDYIIENDGSLSDLKENVKVFLKDIEIFYRRGI